MKKISKLLFAVSLAVSFASCSDFLEEPPRGTQDLNTYFQTEKECIQAVNGCYQSILYNDWWQTTYFKQVSDMCTDDMWAGNTTQDGGETWELCHYMYKGKAGNGVNNNHWQYCYKGIYRCNIAINGINNSPITNETLKARLIAEAKFVRGLIYFELVKNYGGVPLLTKSVAPTEVKMAKSTAEQIYNQVKSDMKSAAQVLPESYSSSDKGRATWGAAMAYLAKACLYTEKWDSARTISAEIIGKKIYKLEPDFANVWSTKNPNGMESIFEVQFNNNTELGTGFRLPVVSGSRDDQGWSWGLPSANLEKAFKDEGDVERLRSTIIKNGDDVYGDPDAKTYVITPSKHKSARICRKYYIPKANRSTPYDGSNHNLNYIMMRYADLLLINAEAAYNSNHPGDALTSLKEVRDRVHLTTDMNLSGNALRDAIYKERRLELATEGHRLYDLRRWKNPTDATKSMLSYIFGANGTFVTWNTNQATADPLEWANKGERQDKGIYFEEGVYNLFPIPQSEIELSGGLLKQNPGL